MEAKTNYTAIGLMVVILTIALLISALWLSVGFDKKKYKIYAVHIHEAVSGLNEEAAVKYNGVQVGSVYKIQLSRVDPQEVIILLNIEKGTPITTSTTATLISQGITGNTYVGLAADSANLTPLEKIPKEPYPIIPAKPSLFNQLDKVLKDVSENVGKVSGRLQDIFDKENTENLRKSLANLQNFTQVIAKHGDAIGRSLDSSDKLLHDMAAASKDLPEIIKELKNNMNKLTKEISTTMVAGKITIDKISQQTLPPAVELLRKFNNIATNLEQLSRQVRQNPAVIVRGSAPATPGPGER